MYRVAITVDPEIAVPPRYYGGIERVAFHIVEALIDRGHDVVLFSSPDSSTRATQIAYPATHSRGWGNTLKNMSTLTTNAWRQPFDIVHSFSRLAYMLPFMATRVPKLMTYQRQVTPRSVAIAHKLAQGTLSFSAVSKAMTRTTENLVDWHIIPNMVDTERLYPAANGTFTTERPLVFLGRIEHIKGVHLAIQCALKTSRQLLIAGNVPDLAHAEDYFSTQIKPFLGEQIKYIGPVDDAEKRSLLCNASAMLMPILWDEPFGIVMAESLACGTPVIALNRGSVPEVIDHGRTGFICQDIEQMVKAIDQLHTLDRNDCRTRALSHYSTDTVVSAYERVYTQMIQPNKSRHLLHS